MELLLRFNTMKKAHLWGIAVVLSIVLTEIIVVVMDVILKEQIINADLIIGLVISGYDATLVVSAAGFFQIFAR